MLADEISPDTCRFWDKETGERLDKDRFLSDLGGVEDAYAEMLRVQRSRSGARWIDEANTRHQDHGLRVKGKRC